MLWLDVYLQFGLASVQCSRRIVYAKISLSDDEVRQRQDCSVDRARSTKLQNARSWAIMYFHFENGKCRRAATERTQKIPQLVSTCRPVTMVASNVSHWSPSPFHLTQHPSIMLVTTLQAYSVPTTASSAKTRSPTLQETEETPRISLAAE